jgi:hypothetical protein
MRSFNMIDYDLREAREDRARHGRTEKQAHELWKQAAQSATCCGDCFRPLSPTDSVTMVARNVGRRRKRKFSQLDSQLNKDSTITTKEKPAKSNS